MTQAIQTHPSYDADDYAYLNAKGWTDQEILDRWTHEAKQGNGPCRWTGAQAVSKLNAVTNRSMM